MKLKKRSKLFNRLFIWILVVFFLALIMGIGLFTYYQTKGLEEALVSEHKLLTQIVSSHLEAGYLGDIWPFETLHKVSRSEKVLFWRILRPNGIVKMADVAKLWGKKMIDIPFVNVNALTVKDAILPKNREKIKLIINPLKIKEKGKNWSFWIGISLKQVRLAQQQLIYTNIALGMTAIFLVAIISFFLARSVTQPISEMVKGVKVLSSGELDHRIKIKSRDEIGQLADSFNKMARALSKTMVSRDYLNNIIKNMTDTLIVLTPDNRIKMVNQATLDLLEYKEDELMGKPMEIVLEKDLIKRGIIQKIETTYLTKEGREIPVYFSNSIMKKDNDKIEGMVCVALDITERKQAEQELKVAQDKLMQSEKLAAMANVAAETAHEIKNPLAVIKTGLYYLNMVIPKEAEKARTKILRMDEATDRAVSYVNDLLGFTRPSALNLAPVKVNRVIEECLKEMPVDILAGIKIEKSFEADLPLIKADPQRLKQVFLNILKNACEAMEEVESKELRFESREEEGFIRISISDTGKGIPREELDKIFDPFFTTKGKGTGLGLAICQRIIEAHNGEIEVVSEVGRGTTFILKLPSIN